MNLWQHAKYNCEDKIISNFIGPWGVEYYKKKTILESIFFSLNDDQYAKDLHNIVNMAYNVLGHMNYYSDQYTPWMRKHIACSLFESADRVSDWPTMFNVTCAVMIENIAAWIGKQSIPIIESFTDCEENAGGTNEIYFFSSIK